ncbi:hypothetical protein CGMCC3_g1956 [Colletotrichum fructicola]|nr:uncharacterized protein CGMCC3_g1956 [Colletotrichum fructicola]KAE9582035.1 hypothetical protein CGMCC3_g1956 [Colletotrichum fructicola]
MKFSIVAFIAVAAGIATAQSLDDAPACARPCVQNESKISKCPVHPPKCLCAKADKERLVKCIRQNCSKEEVKKCLGLAVQACHE